MNYDRQIDQVAKKMSGWMKTLTLHILLTSPDTTSSHLRIYILYSKFSQLMKTRAASGTAIADMVEEMKSIYEEMCEVDDPLQARFRLLLETAVSKLYRIIELEEEARGNGDCSVYFTDLEERCALMVRELVYSQVLVFLEKIIKKIEKKKPF